MSFIKARNIQADIRKHGYARFAENTQTALEDGKLHPNEFSIRELAIALVPNGYQFVEACNPRSKAQIQLHESGSAVNTTYFANITGQIAFNAIKRAYDMPENIFSKMIPNVPTPFNGEKIPGMEQIGDMAAIVPEGMAFPEATFGEDYLETPVTTKRGQICSVTKEAIFFDRTNLILERARQIGEFLGLNKEKRLIDVVAGITNNHKWKGTTYNTYVSTPWLNYLASNELVDWTDVDAAEQIFAGMTDPFTGEAISMGAKTIVTMPKYKNAARRIINATEIRFGDGASSTTQTVAANPLAGEYEVKSSVMLYNKIKATTASGGLGETVAATAAKYWFIGDFAKAFRYMENWPLTFVVAPPNGEAEFERDVVSRYKVSERGAAFVYEPRAIVKCYDTTAL